MKGPSSAHPARFSVGGERDLGQAAKIDLICNSLAKENSKVSQNKNDKKDRLAGELAVLG